MPRLNPDRQPQIDDRVVWRPNPTKPSLVGRIVALAAAHLTIEWDGGCGFAEHIPESVLDEPWWHFEDELGLTRGPLC